MKTVFSCLVAVAVAIVLCVNTNTAQVVRSDLAERCVNNQNYIQMYELEILELYRVNRVRGNQYTGSYLDHLIGQVNAGTLHSVLSTDRDRHGAAVWAGMKWEPAWNNDPHAFQKAYRDQVAKIRIRAVKETEAEVSAAIKNREKEITGHEANLIALRCGEVCMFGRWDNEVKGLGRSVWTITDDGKAQESGIGSVYGTATLSGKTLTVKWRNAGSATDEASPYHGTYVVTLDEACKTGTGTVTWDKHPAADRRGPTFPVTFKRLE